MKVSDRLTLIDKIGRELQSRYTFQDIDIYLAASGIQPPNNRNSNSKRAYAVEAIGGLPEYEIVKIADDLNITSAAGATELGAQPANWKNTNRFRLFISHIAAEKLNATRLKDCLEPYAISGFVAHEDIDPTKEWQEEIERALFCMDAFVAIHTKGFSESNWTQQEIGFAVGMGVKIISLKMGEDPTGFISKRQALQRYQKRAEEIAQEIDMLLSQDALTKACLEEAKIAGGLSPDFDSEIPF